MREILHACRDFFHSCGRFYMLAGRVGEIVSRRETPSQCGRVGSPVETPWRKSLCKVVSKGEGSLEDLEPDGLTKSNLCSDAPFMSFTTLSRIVRGGVMLLQSRAVSHDRTVPTNRPSCILCLTKYPGPCI